MLKKVLQKLLRSHHFWRDISFDELSEIYLSRFVNSVGMSLVGVFVPIFLYKNGVSVFGICIYYVLHNIFRSIFAPLSAYIIARIGPKHGIVIGQSMQVIGMIVLLTFPSMHWNILIPSSINAFSAAIYFLAFHVDFSKVKDSLHGGKEIGTATILEKIGAVVGPVLGGVVATVYGAEYTIVAATGLLALSIIPLLTTSEVIQTRQKLSWKGLGWQRLPDHLSQIGAAVEMSASVFLWPLFLVLILKGTTVYAQVGFISGVSVLVSILIIHAFGMLIDNKRAPKLFHIGVLSNALVHALRAIVTSLSGAFLINILNEPATNAYRMPLIKAVYEEADTLPGQRIAYLAATAVSAFFATAVFWLFVAALVRFLNNDEFALRLAFCVAAVVSLSLFMQRYTMLHTEDNE